MKGKVNCTCGWSWNKSDSSKKDMYICHECGRDNSNNMKNGGWLDNYGEEANANDGHSSASKEWVGDGYSNVGRNYSPAWGGQFQNGGPIKPSQKNYKTQGQYKAALREYELNLRKYELNNNPEKLKGESDKDYENRTKYFKYKVRQQQDKDPVTREYLKIKDDQSADFNPVTKTLRQIFTSPVHVGYGIYNAANPKGLDKYKSRATKNNEDLDLGSSILDVRSLLNPFDYGMKAASLLKQAATRTAKEVAEDQGVDLIKQGNEYINNYQIGGNVYPVNYVPQAQNGTKKKKKGAQDPLRDVENSINKSLGNPMQKAHAAAYELAGKWYNPKTKQWEENDPVDNFRHPMAGRYTSEAIQDKLYNIPILSQMVGFTGSNALGVAHELSTLFNPKDKRGWYDKIRESGEDAFNNAVGATVGSLPISGKAKTNILTRLSNENMIPDGVSGKGGDMYIKHAMGGSIPGSVGFTYARTKGIPSEGPYAKKTMPSAQNGGWLDGYDEAQEGKRVLPNNDRALQILANIQKRKQKGEPSPQFSNVKIKDERGEAVKKVDNTRTASKPKFTDLKKTNVRNKTEAELAEQKRKDDEAILADRKARMADAMKAQDEDIIGNPNWKEVLARETQSTGDKFRLFPNDPDSFIDDWLNPGVMIGDMASSLGAAPYEMERQESMMPLITAIGVPLLTGGLEGIGAKTNRQFVNNLFNPVNMVPGYKSVEKAIGNKLKNITTNIAPSVDQPILSNASNFGNKTKKFLRNNILTDKTFNRLETVNNSLGKLSKAVNPFHHIEAKKSLKEANDWMDNWYNDPITKEKIKKASSRFGPNSYNEEKLLENIENKNYRSSFEANMNKVDNFLDGNPRVHKGNYGVSGWDLDFYKDTSKRQNLVDKYINPDIITSTAIHEGNHGLTDGNNLIRGYEDILHSPFDTTNFKPRLDDGSFEKNSDYLLDPTEINARISEIRYEHGLKPGEDLTLDKTNDIINKGLLGKSKVSSKFFKLINDRNKFRDMMNYVPAVIGAGATGTAAYQMQGEEPLPGMREGGIIKDNRGQWDHPGEITEINSNNITMQGVPYPVLGISDTGHTQMMYPGQDYKFKGKKVTEFPVAQKGKKVSGGLGIEDWWNNRKEIQSTYRMANEVDPFMKNWMNNPITQKRLNDQIGYLMEDNKKPINVINENLNTLPVYDQKKMRGKKTSDFISNYKLQNDLGSEYPDSQFEVYFNNLREEPYVAGSYVPDIHSMSVADINDKGTLVHEMTHGSGIQDEMEHYMQFKYNQKPDPNYPEGSYKKNDYDYLKRDGMYPRIMDIRRELNLKPGQKVDKRIFNGNNIKTDSAIQDLREMYDDDEILHIMNTIADNSKSKKLSTAKNGLRQEQKGLQNLDNLLNFTNYNKPQPGGWLNKYN